MVHLSLLVVSKVIGGVECVDQVWVGSTAKVAAFRSVPHFAGYLKCKLVHHVCECVQGRTFDLVELVVEADHAHILGETQGLVVVQVHAILEVLSRDRYSIVVYTIDSSYLLLPILRSNLSVAF